MEEAARMPTVLLRTVLGMYFSPTYLDTFSLIYQSQQILTLQVIGVSGELTQFSDLICMIFCAFFAHLASKFEKSTNMT